jgi:hypothetical protein
MRVVAMGGAVQVLWMAAKASAASSTRARLRRSSSGFRFSGEEHALSSVTVAACAPAPVRG